MPSDTALTSRALEALAPRVEAFHSAVATTEEEIRTFVAQRRGAGAFRAERAVMELGPFAVGRIDPQRFALLLDDDEELTPEAERVLERAEEVLSDFALAHDDHVVRVEPGGDLRDAVRDRLAHVGQVFGVSRAVELARGGLYDPERHGAFLGRLEYRKWNRAERQLAPPLVVEVEPDDLLPAGLGEFLDGQVKIVLVVEGPTTPAPLARLITPGTYVLQTGDPEALRALAESPHPGIGLLFDEVRDTQARFVHDPEGGQAPWERLTVEHMPERPRVGRGRRPPAWLEDLAHLEMLAARPAGVQASGNGTAPVVEGAAEPAASPADQLAAWLLTQTNLEGL